MVPVLAEGVELLPGAKELLVELAAAGVPTALVSASPRSIVDACLGGIGADFFRHTVSGDDVVRFKPHPEPYLLAARLLGVDPEQCVVIEDSPTGTASGAAAGCRVLSVPHPGIEIAAHPRVTLAPGLDGVDLAFLSTLR
jgi:HAD superfamily hydrolase (TIGR01509 family)